MSSGRVILEGSYRMLIGWLMLVAGADPGFFLGRGAPLKNGVTNTNKPHFFAEHQVY